MRCKGIFSLGIKDVGIYRYLHVGIGRQLPSDQLACQGHPTFCDGLNVSLAHCRSVFSTSAIIALQADMVCMMPTAQH